MELFGALRACARFMFAVDPGFGVGWLKRGTLFHWQGRFRAIRKDAHRAFKREPLFFGALHGVGALGAHLLLSA